MAVAFDAKSTSPTEFNNGFTSPQTDTSLTIGSSATSLVVWVELGSASQTLATCTGVTWNGVSMTLLSSKIDFFSQVILYCFGLVNPATGNHTISASFSGSTTDCSGGILGVSWSGTDTAGTSTCFPAANILTDASTALSVYPVSAFSVTTANGDAVCAGMNISNVPSFSMNIGTLLAQMDNFDPNAAFGYALASGTSTSIQFAGSGGGNSASGIALRIVQASGSGGSVGSSSGTSGASGVGKSSATSVASSTGTGTASGVGRSTATSVGSASGVGTATGIGRALLTAIATSTGSGTASGIGISTAASIGSASGIGTASATGQSTATSVASSAGTSTVTGIALSTAASVGSASGSATVLGVGQSIGGGSAGTSVGIGTASGIGASTATSTASSSGTATVSGVGASLFSSVATSTGVGIATGVGLGSTASIATSSGVSTATGIAVSTAASVGSSAGIGTATGVGNSSSTSSVGIAAGTSTVLGFSAVTISSVGTASGSCVVTGVSDFVVGGGKAWRWKEGYDAVVKHTSETYHNKYPQSHTDDVKKAAAHMSSLGGQARAKSLTSTQRSNIATKAAQARWK